MSDFICGPDICMLELMCGHMTAARSHDEIILLIIVILIILILIIAVGTKS